ncbi:MAG: AbrB/MazE/SpoVT family DNA-binding domain-containing protein [Acidianus hospitalis]
MEKNATIGLTKWINFLQLVQLISYGLSIKGKKKGIVILPKDVRVKLSINENDILIANIEGDKLVLRPLKPKIVRVDPKVVEDILK